MKTAEDRSVVSRIPSWSRSDSFYPLPIRYLRMGKGKNRVVKPRRRDKPPKERNAEEEEDEEEEELEDESTSEPGTDEDASPSDDEVEFPFRLIF
uniref:Uncharacterized protein n=1 Tax=Caenorhabditis japonica TaxID=281687 RepID=A0A8R1EGZ8_CAEJA